MVFIHNRKSASDRLCKMSIMCDSNQCLSCPVKILQIPAACPVVPPGSGTLNIIPRNEKAAPIPRSGILTFGISVLTLLIEYPQTGTMAAVLYRLPYEENFLLLFLLESEIHLQSQLDLMALSILPALRLLFADYYAVDL